MYMKNLQVFAWLETGENIVLEIKVLFFFFFSLCMQLNLKAGLVKH